MVVAVVVMPEVVVAVSVDEEWPTVLKFFGGRLPGGVEFLLDVDQSVTRQYYCVARGACPDSFKFPETYIDDMGLSLRWPKAAEAPVEVWVSKRK